MSSIPRNKAIVVVEDDRLLADLIRDALETEPHYHAVAVRDGARALGVVRAIKASLVLLDLNLPGLNGLQIYDLLQKDSATRDIPVIFVTANHQSQALRDRGITNIIPKPFELDDLLSRVAEVFALPQ